MDSLIQKIHVSALVRAGRQQKSVFTVYLNKEEPEFPRDGLVVALIYYAPLAHVLRAFWVFSDGLAEKFLLIQSKLTGVEVLERRPYLTPYLTRTKLMTPLEWGVYLEEWVTMNTALNDKVQELEVVELPSYAIARTQAEQRAMGGAH
jgi:hypothetical protein